MTNHPDTKEIQIKGCYALAKLKSALGGKEAIFAARGVSAVAACAEKYHGNEPIKKAVR